MSIRKMVRLPGLALLVVLATATPGAAAARPEPGPALATPITSLEQALECSGDLSGAQRDPVLLIHGTFADSEVNWSWNYAKALPARGEPTCTVDLPDRAAWDIQVSSEYVVHAIRTMARESGRRVAIIGHSQGGLEARWALRWWPDLRHKVSDVIMLATPNHGSAFSDVLCTSPNACAASLYQMRTESMFLAALNHGRDTIGAVPFTAVVTADDNVVVLPQQGILDANGKLTSNVVVQDLCANDRVNHVGLAFDGPTYAIAVDALDHPGPADLSRIEQEDPAVCDPERDTMPGVDPDEANANLQAYAVTLAELLGPNGPKAEGEPALACYAAHTCSRLR